LINRCGLISKTCDALKLLGSVIRQISMDDRIRTAARELRRATEAILQACIARDDLNLRRARTWAASVREELRAELWAAALMRPMLPAGASSQQ
jgi:hypothetical protein